MAYNRENNLDDLITLTKGADETFYLVLEDYDGKGSFSNPPLVYGLSQVVHIYRGSELSKTVGEVLEQYPDGSQFLNSKDRFNLTTDKNFRVSPRDPLWKVFGGDHKATLYVQNKEFNATSYELMEEGSLPGEGEQQQTVKKFSWGKCIVIFGVCWIVKFIILFGVLYVLRMYHYI